MQNIFKRLRLMLGGIVMAMVIQNDPVSLAQDVPQDFERRLGTPSRPAAELFQKGVAAFRASKHQASSEHFQAALKLDAKFQLAIYWLAQAYEAVGQHDEEMQTYQRLYDSREHELNSIVVEGCINAGLAEGKRGKFESSEFWFSRALALDPSNKFKKSAQAYRNLAITKFNKKDFTSAAIVSSLGHQIDPKGVPESMFKAAAKNAKREVATIVDVTTNDRLKKIPYRDRLGVDEERLEVSGISESLNALVDVYPKQKLVGLPNEGKFLYVVDYATSKSNALTAKKISLQGRPRAATFVDGRLFLSITSPHRLAEIDIDSGKELKSWELTEAAPKSIAAAPSRMVAFLCSDSVIRILDLKTGQVTLSDFEATGIASDPNQEFLFAFRTPPSKSNEQRGHFLVQGRPVFFTIQNETFNWSQSTLLRFMIAEGGQLLLSQVRINAASNAKRIHVSADGRIVALVGGGGWRPTDRASGSGYGIPFFNARDLSNVYRFVQTDAYPQVAAVSPVNHLILASGGKNILSHLVNDDQLELKLDEKPLLAKFSGDGRWLFLGSTTKLYAFSLKNSKDDLKARDWFKK